MFASLLVYVVIVIRASPHNYIRDDLFMQDLTEDPSLPVELANANIFDDSPIVSSADDDLTGDLFLNTVDGTSIGTLDLGQDFDVKGNPPMEHNFDPSLFGVNGEGEDPLVGDMALTSDSYGAEEDFPIELLDSSISTAPCNSQGGSSFKSLDSSSSTTLFDLGENPELMASDDLNPETPQNPDSARHKPSWRYTIEPVYELSPDIGPTVDTSAAYAEDGTPIKPARCPPRSKKSCCTDDTHTSCWHYPLNVQVCRYARKLYCCDDIPEQGGPGISCQAMKWIYERTRFRKDPPSNQPNPLQGIFDIFQFPDLNPKPNPSYCPNPSRF